MNVVATTSSAGLRYRAIHVQWMPDETMAYGEAREFKTLKGATAYRDTQVGKTILIQTGVIRWLPDEEAGNELTRLQAEGARIE